MSNKKLTIDNPEYYSQCQMFDSKTVTREELLYWFKFWQPLGSGNLTLCKFVCYFLLDIMKFRGMEIPTQKEMEAISHKTAADWLRSQGKLTSENE